MNRKTSTAIVRTIDLDHEQLLILDDRAGARIRVLSGGTWLTEEGRLDDVHATPGDSIMLTTRGRAVLEGVGRARVEIVLPQRGGWKAGLAQLGSVWRSSQAALALRGGAVVLSLALALGLADLVARGLQHSGEVPAAHVS